MTLNKNVISRIYLFALFAIVIWLLVDRGSDMFDLFSNAQPLPIIALVGLALLPFFANTGFWTIALRAVSYTHLTLPTNREV